VVKGGLGKGLNLLIDSASAEIGSSVDYVDIPIDKVIPNPNQPRMDFSDERIEELATSIRKDGLLQPILVRPEGDGFQIVAGERRWQACRRLEMQTIPAKIIIASDAEAQQIALVENLQRDNLNAIEEARGYQRLIELSGCLQKDLAEAVSKKPTTISNALRLLDLPDEVQDLMFEGLLTSGHGRAILSVPNEETRIRLAKKIVDEHLSVRETENLARLYATQGLERTKRPPSPRSFKTVARRLRQMFDTNVRVKSVRGKNRIEIEFKDEDDLERIFLIIGQDTTASTPRKAAVGFVGMTEEPAITYSRDLVDRKVSFFVDEPEEDYEENEGEDANKTVLAEFEPEPNPEPDPESGPEATPEAAPEAAPEATPEAALEAAPEDEADLEPEGTSGPAPEPEVIPGPVPNPEPEVTPSPASELEEPITEGKPEEPFSETSVDPESSGFEEPSIETAAKPESIVSEAPFAEEDVEVIGATEEVLPVEEDESPEVVETTAPAPEGEYGLFEIAGVTDEAAGEGQKEAPAEPIDKYVTSGRNYSIEDFLSSHVPGPNETTPDQDDLDLEIDEDEDDWYN
jgi:ParB family chromosome partitioning protein